MPKPRILIYDIESTPIKFWGWRTGKTYLSHENIVAGQKTGIICICYKWLGDTEIHSLDWGLKSQNSDKVVDEFSKILEQADIAVAHNGDGFDAKHINTQRWLSGKPPIAWPTSEDTLKMCRKHFALPSNRLDYIAKLVTGSGKSPMSFQDWIDIVDNKDPDALEKMIKYCRRDVSKLAKVYRSIFKHCKPKAHRGLMMGTGTSSCPSCGSTRSRSKGLLYRMASVLQRRQCKDCGHEFSRRAP